MDSASNQNAGQWPAHSLRELWTKGPATSVPVEISLYIAVEACRELERLHGARDGATHQILGLAHGAVSVETVSVCRDGTVRIGGGKTPPERGDHRRDLYGMGAVLFESLTGVAFNPAAKNSPRIGSMNAAVTTELERIVLKALSTTSSLRYPDAGTFQRSLQRFLQESFPNFEVNQVRLFMEQRFPDDTRERPLPVMVEKIAELPEPVRLPEPPPPAPSPLPPPVVDPPPVAPPSPRAVPWTWIAVALLGLGAILALFFSRPARAESKNLAVIVEVTGNGHFTSSDADKVSGADYGKKYSTSLDASVSLGFLLLRRLYLGVQYVYWFAGRRFTVGGVETIDSLLFQSAAAEAGLYFESNPRIFWRFSAAVFYPLKLQVASTTSGTGRTFQGGSPLSYQGRVSIGFNLTKRFSTLLHLGYRQLNVKDLQSDGSSYLTDGADFNLSGILLGLGLAVRF